MHLVILNMWWVLYLRARDSYFFSGTPGLTFFQHRFTLPKEMYTKYYICKPWSFPYRLCCLSVPSCCMFTWLVLWRYLSGLCLFIFVFGLLCRLCLFLSSFLSIMSCVGMLWWVADFNFLLISFNREEFALPPLVACRRSAAPSYHFGSRIYVWSVYGRDFNFLECWLFIYTNQ